MAVLVLIIVPRLVDTQTLFPWGLTFLGSLLITAAVNSDAWKGVANGPKQTLLPSNGTPS